MITNEEKKLFREAVEKIKPVSTKTSNSIVIPEQNYNDIIIELEDYNFCKCEPNENLFFAKPGLQTKILKKMHQGKFQISDKIDLHGMTQEQAKKTLTTFLAKSLAKNNRHLLIIHGKGSAIIKSAVNTWLRNFERTLAFCSATPKDGGTGAIYLFLK